MPDELEMPVTLPPELGPAADVLAELAAQMIALLDDAEFHGQKLRRNESAGWSRKPPAAGRGPRAVALSDRGKTVKNEPVGRPLRGLLNDPILQRPDRRVGEPPAAFWASRRKGTPCSRTATPCVVQRFDTRGECQRWPVRRSGLGRLYPKE